MEQRGGGVLIPGRCLDFLPTVEAIGLKQGRSYLLSYMKESFSYGVQNGLSWGPEQRKLGDRVGVAEG